MNGHRLRTWAMVRALADEGHRVTLVSFAEPDEMKADLAPLREMCRVVDLVPSPAASAQRLLEPFRRLRALAAPMPYGAWKFRSGAFRAAIERRLAEHAFDAVICDGIYNVQNLPWPLSVPVLLNKDDVAHVIVRRYLALERNRLLRLYGALEARKIERWETKSLHRAQAVLACSDFDRMLLRRLCPSATVFVVPNVVDTDHYAPRDGAEPLTVLFQGGMDWHPNRDAVAFFSAEILPALRRLLPDVRFRVAGRSPSEKFRRRFDRGAHVEFTGTVADMRAEIQRATVCVVPLRIGSGTRLKILEAAAMGKAIVSTTLGAEGLDFVPDREIVLADDSERFAKTIADLANNLERRRTVGAAARARVQEQYSLSVLQRRLGGALSALIEPSEPGLATATSTPEHQGRP
jgi:glycosyltransferase involved in cell wall biosynthesis